jgi:hypothetical protein
MALIPVTDHAQRVDDSLAQQYRDATAPGVREVAQAIAFEGQDVEDALWSILNKTPLSAAIGYQLERMGALVGEQRNGDSDEPYWVRVAARILVNRSSGSVNELLAIFSLLTAGLATLHLVDQLPAAFVLKVNGIAVSVPGTYATLLRQARKGGVRSILEYSTAPTGSGFCFAGGTGRGFPDAILTPGSGGKLAGAQE